MEQKLVSIVVPVYNVEKYLNRCMESLVNQTYKNIEIILVDDLSKDHSLELCREWEKKGSRVRVVPKERNEGAGKARNTGMQVAAGQYIMFVDSDDYLALNTVETCMSSCEETSAEAIVFGHHDVNNSGQIVGSYHMYPERKVFEGKQVRESFVPDLIAADPRKRNAAEPPHARAMMFETQALKEHNWHFVSEREIISEDVYSLTEVYLRLKKVVVIPAEMYYYCENSTSITHSFNKEYFEKIQPFYWEMRALCESYQQNDEIVLRIAAVSLSFVIAAMKKEMTSISSWREQRKRIEEIVNDQWLHGVLRTVGSDQHNKKRNILFGAMRMKMVLLVWILVFYRAINSK